MGFLCPLRTMPLNRTLKQSPVYPPLLLDFMDEQLLLDQISQRFLLWFYLSTICDFTFLAIGIVLYYYNYVGFEKMYEKTWQGLYQLGQPPPFINRTIHRLIHGYLSRTDRALLFITQLIANIFYARIKKKNRSVQSATPVFYSWCKYCLEGRVIINAPSSCSRPFLSIFIIFFRIYFGRNVVFSFFST